MKKIIICLFTSILLIAVSALPALALPSGFDQYTNGNYPRVIDKAELLDSVQEKSFLEQIENIVQSYDFGVAIITTDTLEGMDITVFCEQIFDGCGYGIGPDRDGILFLISMEERDWNIDAHAYGATAFNDYGRENIGRRVQPLLTEGDYAGAFSSFLDYVDIFLTQAASGDPYSSSNPYVTTNDVFAILPVTFIVSFVIALIIVLIMRYRMKTARPKPLAHEYIRQGSFTLTGRSDMFLYSSVSKTRREKSSSSSSSRGSGSHRHTRGKF